MLSIIASLTCIIGIVEYLFCGKHNTVFFFSRIALFLLNILCGISYKITGKLPSNDSNGYVIAAKHQSMLEVIIFMAVFHTVNFVVKKEFLRIPILSTYWKMLGVTCIDRNNYKQSIKAIKNMTNRTDGLSDDTLIIFPEGTRKSIGAKPDYKQGVYLLYSIVKKPVVPIALNTGVYWMRNNKISKPGVVCIDILKPIEIGLSKDDFMKQLQDRIETRTDELVAAQIATSEKD
ncbi:lysophospholipid acyltransferase family protein [Candidatus Xenohaliotis californiensis]